MLTEQEILAINNSADYVTAFQKFRGGHDSPKYVDILRRTFPGSVPCIRLFALKKKLMGSENILWVSEQTEEYQNRFCTWFADKNWKAEKNEIQLWLADNPGRPTT